MGWTQVPKFQLLAQRLKFTLLFRQMISMVENFKKLKDNVQKLDPKGGIRVSDLI